jgi:hypothetical protein
MGHLKKVLTTEEQDRYRIKERNILQDPKDDARTIFDKMVIEVEEEFIHPRKRHRARTKITSPTVETLER